MLSQQKLRLSGALRRKLFPKENTDIKKTKEDRLPAYHEHGKRVTVKRGIFPSMIRTKVIKRKLFNHGYVSTTSNHSDETGQSELYNFDRIDMIRSSSRTPDNIRERPTSTDGDKKVETIMSNSPYLLHANQADVFQIADDNAREESRPAYLKTPRNAAKKKRIDFITPSLISYEAEDDRAKKDKDSFQKLQETEEEAKKREYEDMKCRITQVESCSPREAELTFYYLQFTESIKRLMIVERETNFEPFPNAFETIKNKLHALKALRSKKAPSQNPVDNFASDCFRPLGVPPEKYEDVFTMDVDEDSQNPLFRTPSPAPLHNNAVNELSALKSSSVIFDKEADMMPPPFDFQTRKETVFDFKPKDVQSKSKHDTDFLPPVVIREVQNPVRDEVKKTDWTLIDSEFNAHQKRLIEFSSDRPSFAIGDTIDQNAGLDGIEYLKNVSKKEPKNSHDHEVENKTEWWNSHVNKYKDDRRVIDVDSDLLQWRNAAYQQFHVPETIASNNVQFTLPRESSQRDDDHEFFPPKRFTNFGRIFDGEKSFFFNTETVRSSEMASKYFNYRVEDDAKESPLFGSPLSAFRR